MVEKNNNIPDTPDKKSKNLHLGEDFEMWLKGSKEQRNLLEIKTHLDAQSQLADLRESFGQKSLEKERASADTAHSHFAHQNNSGASFEIVQTRQKEDVNKNIFQGVAESIYVPFRALKDTFIDATKIVFSPVKETKNTIALLKQESPNTEIV